MRPVRPSDYDGLFALARDPQVWALHPNSDRYEESVFRAYFEEGLASRGALVASCRSTGRLVGWSRYSRDNVEADEIEIGWTFLGRSYWGGAHNRDMKEMMLEHAFRYVDRVVFRIGAANLRSRRAIEKLGAVLLPAHNIGGLTTEPTTVRYFITPEAAATAFGISRH